MAGLSGKGAGARILKRATSRNSAFSFLHRETGGTRTEGYRAFSPSPSPLTPSASATRAPPRYRNDRRVMRLRRLASMFRALLLSGVVIGSSSGFLIRGSFTMAYKEHSERSTIYSRRVSRPATVGTKVAEASTSTITSPSEEALPVIITPVPPTPVPAVSVLSRPPPMEHPFRNRPSSLSRKRKRLTKDKKVEDEFEWLMERQYESAYDSVLSNRLMEPEDLSTKIVEDLQKRYVSPSPFHLHIGAGRLGLGLVVPAVARSGTPLGILQRPSNAWSPVFPKGPQTIDIIVNEEAVCPQMGVVRDLHEFTSALAAATEAGEKRPNIFVVTEDIHLLKLLVSTATTFSMSLGPYMTDVVPLLEHLPVIETPEHASLVAPSDVPLRPVLYAAENDHKMVEEVAKALKGRVDVCTVMVDRICVSRTVTDENVAVQCEPYDGEMVVIQTNDAITIPPPFAGGYVRVPDLETEAEYFCRRKFLLVNGSHTTLAFLTLCLRQPRVKDPGGGGHVTTPEDHQLLNWENCGEQYHKEIWAWTVARIMMLLTEYETSSLRSAHNVETDEELLDQLLEYATETLTRFSSAEDTTSRVLQGGVSNRWEGRLKSVDRFMESVHVTPVIAMLLDKADLKLPYMKKVISRLSVDSKRFTRARPVDKNKLVAA